MSQNVWSAAVVIGVLRVKNIFVLGNATKLTQISDHSRNVLFSNTMVGRWETRSLIRIFTTSCLSLTENTKAQNWYNLLLFKCNALFIHRNKVISGHFSISWF